MKCFECEKETIECPMEGMKCIECAGRLAREWQIAHPKKAKPNKKDRGGA